MVCRFLVLTILFLLVSTEAQGPCGECQGPCGECILKFMADYISYFRNYGKDLLKFERMVVGLPLDTRNIKNKAGTTPLLYLAGFGTAEMVEIMVRHGAKIDDRNLNGQTALHLASDPGRGLEVQTADIIKVLLDHEADIHAQDVLQRTALHYAAFYGNVESVNVLLENGALDNIDANGHTAFHLAQKYGREDIANVLRQHRHQTNEQVVAQKRKKAACFELNSDCLICHQEFAHLRGSNKESEVGCLKCLQRFHPKCVHRWANIKDGECALCRTPTFGHYDQEPPSNQNHLINHEHPSTGSSDH